MANKTCCLQELIKKDVLFKFEHQHKDAFFENVESLLKANKASLKLPIPDKRLVRMCDAAGYVLLIKHLLIEHDPSAKQSYAPSLLDPRSSKEVKCL